MIKIIYPDKKPAIKKDGDKERIFCIIRKRWLMLTPEEWVRQNFLIYLTQVLQYPSSLIAVEKQILLWEVKKRFDIVVYKNTKPFMVVECKEMNVPLSDHVTSQVNRYNTNMQADYLFITNGRECIGFQKDSGSFKMISRFPAYQ